LPYPLFALAGLLPWSFFAAGVTSCSSSIIASERLITKIYFPRLAIPLSAVGAAAVDSFIALALLAAMMGYYQVAPGLSVLLIPVVYLAVFFTALGIGTALAALTVSYRDFRHLTPFLMQLWMFATPAVYMDTTAASSSGSSWLWLVNPMTGLIATFRSACLGGEIPWVQFAIAAQFGLVLFLAGVFYFRRVEDRFADVI
jgi:lipopolysaccharide transport system permease protein